MQAVSSAREALAHKANGVARKLKMADQQMQMQALQGFQKGAGMLAEDEEEAEQFAEDANNFMAQFMKGRAGQAMGMGMGGGLLGRILTIVVVPIVLLIGLVIYGNFNSALDTSQLSPEAQSAINNTNDNAYSGFNLAAILPLVLAGVAILSIVIGAFAFGLAGPTRR